MGQTTGISWTDSTWSPLRARVRPDALEIATAKGYTSLLPILKGRAIPGKVGHHCEHASPGCEHCYSETNNGRCLPSNGTGLPFDRRSRDLVEMFIDEDILQWPLKWRKGRRIFVESQSDLFGEFVPDELIDRVFAVMALCSQHTFQVLTKRTARMREYFADPDRPVKMDVALLHAVGAHSVSRACFVQRGGVEDWPLPNVWLGCSVEDQQRADERIPLLLQTPAAVRFLSVEPLLGPVDLTHIEFRRATWYDALQDHDGFGLLHAEHQKIDWVIAGGESGPGARPLDIAWIRSIVAQCAAAGVACFVKQLGAFPCDDSGLDGTAARCDTFGRSMMRFKDRKGGDPAEWSADLRVQQFPEAK